jgi:hypothetical protein
MTQQVNFVWPQGEDLGIRLVYKEGNAVKTARPVPLNSGYEVRMDIVVSETGEVKHTFLSSDHPGSLGSGGYGEANINIILPRSLNLPGGLLYELGTGLSYDLFLRNTQTDTQIKILRGHITIQESNTLWP